jgi:hypothetical protein
MIRMPPRVSKWLSKALATALNIDPYERLPTPNTPNLDKHPFYQETNKKTFWIFFLLEFMTHNCSCVF